MNIPPQLAARYSTVNGEDLLKQVVVDYQIETPRHCLFFERGANDTYEVRCADDVRYSLRVYRCGAFPREAIEFEIDALNHLHQQGFPVAYPIARNSGGYLTEIGAPEGNRFVLLTAFADGTTPNYDSPKNCQLVGESVAQMHLAFSNFETRHKRTHLNLKSLLEESIAVIQPRIAHRPGDLRFVTELARDARVAFGAIPEESLGYGVCHGDLHGYNLHIHDGQVTHFDFEECAFGYWVYDLATFKWGVCNGDQQAMQWAAFLEGYQSVRPIAETELSLIDTFVIIRDLSNIAFGFRNVEDFGHELTSEGNIDHLCKQLKHLRDNAQRKPA